MSESIRFENNLEPELLKFIEEQNWGLENLHLRGIKPDAVLDPGFIIEITMNTSSDNLRKLAYKGNKYQELEDYWGVLILPFERLTPRKFEIVHEVFDFILDVKDYKPFLKKIIAAYDKDEDNDNEIVKLYRDYYGADGFGLKGKMWDSVINLHFEQFMVVPQKTGKELKNGAQTIDDKIKQSDSETNPKFIFSVLAPILSDIFPRISHRIKSEKLLDIIRREGQIEASQQVYKKIGATQSEYYDTLLKKLKKSGLLRKQGMYLTLNSTYSLKEIQKARAWIEFAGIQKSQPKELARFILSIYGLEEYVEK